MDPVGIPVFDGHNDLLLDLATDGHGQGRSFFERSDRGHIDLPRAREGGLAGGLFAVFVPAPPGAEVDAALRRGELQDALELGFAQREASRVAAGLFRRERAGGLRIARDLAGIESAMSAGSLAAVLHLEGADAIDADLDALEIWVQAGLRSLGITWCRRTLFGEGVPFAAGSLDTGSGLTPIGFELVDRCNALGILIDLSHLNAAGFWDVAGRSRAPLVASHSNAHAICPVTRPSRSCSGIWTPCWHASARPGSGSARTSTAPACPRPSATSAACRACSPPWPMRATAAS